MKGNLSRAIVISSFFPPLHSAGGSIRLVKFLKYLSTLGWQFIVFTQEIPTTVFENETRSSFLLDELPEQIEIQRNSGLLSSRQSSKAMRWIQKKIHRVIGDSSLGWGIRTLASALAELRKTETDLIFSVMPPFNINALVAMSLSWIGHKPMVLDLKDDWVASPNFLQKNIIRQWIEKSLEAIVVRHASAVITVTPASHISYTERYAHLGTPGKFHLIPNGCDLDEYQTLKHRERKISSSRFLILSAAWGYRKDYRDISPFLLALGVFFQRHPEAKGNMDVVLLGDSLSKEYEELLAKLALNEVIQVVGTVRRHDLVEWLWRADLFLLIQPVGNTTAISGTLYEYWATGKAPILLISERGASSALIDENQLGRHFHYRQTKEIADYIEQLFIAYQNRHPIWIERNGIQNYDRRFLAKQMKLIWDESLSKK